MSGINNLLSNAETAEERSDIIGVVSHAIMSAEETGEVFVVGLHPSLGWVYRHVEESREIDQLTHRYRVDENGVR